MKRPETKIIQITPAVIKKLNLKWNELEFRGIGSIAVAIFPEIKDDEFYHVTGVNPFTPQAGKYKMGIDSDEYLCKQGDNYFVLHKDAMGKALEADLRKKIGE